MKLLAIEMVGMDPHHETNTQGSTKDLAMTMMQCILLQPIQNNTE